MIEFHVPKLGTPDVPNFGTITLERIAIRSSYMNLV